MDGLAVDGLSIVLHCGRRLGSSFRARHCFDTADQILGLQRNTARAVIAGAMPEAPAQAWLTRLAHSTVAAGFTVYLVIAEA